VDEKLKELITAIRSAMPDWANNAVISMTLTPLPPEGDIIITFNGVPPTDVVTVTWLDNTSRSIVIKNWGNKVVEGEIAESQET